MKRSQQLILGVYSVVAAGMGLATFMGGFIGVGLFWAALAILTGVMLATSLGVKLYTDSRWPRAGSPMSVMPLRGDDGRKPIQLPTWALKKILALEQAWEDYKDPKALTDDIAFGKSHQVRAATASNQLFGKKFN